MRKQFIIAATIFGLCTPADSSEAGSVGDFFKAVGNSIAHPGQHPKSKPRDSQSANKRPKSKGGVQTGDFPPDPTGTPMPSATPTATQAQPSIRVASVPAQKNSAKRDVPYAIPVPNKPGFVTSPYAPKQGLVDVRGFPSGTEVLDPYSGKLFLTP